MSPKKSLLADVAIVLALILLGVIGYKLSPVLLPKSDVSVNPDVPCNLNQAACTATLPGGGRLRLAFEPRPIPVAAPISASVELEGGAAESVAIDFAGIGMNMGLNRPALAAAGNGRFAAQVTLPVCVTGRMEWQATVLVETGRQRIAIPFRFEAGS